MWVFDDKSVGLDKEAFVAGADRIMDLITAMKDIKNPERGFRLIFSENEFPAFDFKFVWIRQEFGGNVYASEDFQIEGWLCPALFKYFDNVPKSIHVKVESCPPIVCEEKEDGLV
jgi:hypothetical protein